LLDFATVLIPAKSNHLKGRSFVEALLHCLMGQHYRAFW